MDIRKDFESVAPFIHRLAGIGDQFAHNNMETWSHLKNREDFSKIYLLPFKDRFQLEELYAKGRESASFMASRLHGFNDVGQFPSLTDYVDSFDGTWVHDHENLLAFLIEIQGITDVLEHPPWAVRRMIVVFEDQLRLLASVRKTLDLLKKSNLYKIENGEAPVEKESGITIGSINGKVNIHSTDNSTNITIDSSPVFSGLREAISQASIEASQKSALLESAERLQQSVGTGGFVQTYKSFMQAAANHMTVIAPFVPALTALIS